MDVFLDQELWWECRFVVVSFLWEFLTRCNLGPFFLQDVHTTFLYIFQAAVH